MNKMTFSTLIIIGIHLLKSGAYASTETSLVTEEGFENFARKCVTLSVHVSNEKMDGGDYNIYKTVWQEGWKNADATGVLHSGGQSLYWQTRGGPNCVYGQKEDVNYAMSGSWGPIDGHDGLASRDMFIRAMDSALNMVTDRTRYPIGYNKHQGTRICDYHDTGWGRSLPRTIRVDGWNSCDGGASAGYLQIDFSTNSSNSGMCSAIAGLATIGGAIPVLGPLTSIVSGLITVACN